MCVGCVRTQIDITADIPKQVVIHFCRSCERYCFWTNTQVVQMIIWRTINWIYFDRYLEPPSEWITCALESRELLSLCLHRLKGLNRVKLVDASFIWTEPHSKRMKVCSVFSITTLICRVYQWNLFFNSGQSNCPRWSNGRSNSTTNIRRRIRCC